MIFKCLKYAKISFSRCGESHLHYSGRYWALPSCSCFDCGNWWHGKLKSKTLFSFAFALTFHYLYIEKCDFCRKMKKLVIHIDELGPIRDASLELAPVMIFTGNSNLGKSYTNFLAYYVFYLFSGNRLSEFLRERIRDKDDDARHKFSFSFEKEELERWMEDDVRSFFIYLLNYPDVPCRVHFSFGDDTEHFTVTMKDEEKTKPAIPDFRPVSITTNGKRTMVLSKRDSILDAVVRPFAQQLGRILLGVDIIHAFLLPPGRASLLNESYTNQKNSSKTGMYDIFLSDFDFINFMNMRKKSLAHMRGGNSDCMTKIVEKAIDGILESSKDGMVLKIDGDTVVPLSAAASSIKELSPLVLWAQTGMMKGFSTCIEEPEAHAHPDMQYDIADLLSVCIMNGALMQMTTHSDYMLARLNWLMKMYDLKMKNPERFERVCKERGLNKEIALDKKFVSAYYFYKDDSTNTVKIERQDVSKGVPFTTFSKAVDKQIEWNEIFEDPEDEAL